MTFTKNQIKQAIYEELIQIKEEEQEGMDADLKAAFDKLIEKLEGLDLSIDYLAGVMSGESPYMVDIGQKQAGRYISPQGPPTSNKFE
tara:strand:- start:654 stop:917 length:264 start_codon:yes stop_codon:yes gene_type:complete